MTLALLMNLGFAGGGAAAGGAVGLVFSSPVLHSRMIQVSVHVDPD